MRIPRGGLIPMDFDTNGFEELRMAEGQPDKFSNLYHLLTTTTDVVITNVIGVCLFVLAFDRVTL